MRHDIPEQRPSSTAPEASKRLAEGFSLVELLIGTFVVIVALGAVIAVTLRISSLRKVDDQLNLAYMAVMSNMEDVRAMPYAQVPALHGTGFDVPALNGTAGGLRPVPGDADGLAGQFRVTVEQSGGGTTLYRVTAEVRWAVGSGERSLTMTTLVGQREFN